MLEKLTAWLVMVCSLASAALSPPAQPAAAPAAQLEVQPAYSMLCAPPEDALLLSSAEAGDVQAYTNAAGDYELVLQPMPGMDGLEAIQALSGFDPARLTVVTTRRFDMPVYHVGWYAASEEGDRLCRAAIAEDRDCCYALVFCVAASRYDDYQDAVAATVSTLGLFSV